MPSLGATVKTAVSPQLEALKKVLESRLKTEFEAHIDKIVREIINKNSPDKDVNKEQTDFAVKSMKNFLSPLLKNMAEDISTIVAEEIKKIFETQFNAMDTWFNTVVVATPSGPGRLV